MKTKLFFLLTTIISLNCYSQISFEKGYYINNSDQRVDCLIKNIDWLNNPTKFEYKLTEDSEEKIGVIKLVKEFGINTVSKYVRKTINIDRSSEKLSDLTSDQNPIFKEEELFLKILVEGKSNLYHYVDNGDLERFFYDKGDNNIEQLIYKSYKTNEGQIGRNYKFRQQLWSYLRCPTFTLKKLENLEYRKNEMVRYFVEYNECSNHNYTNYEKKQKNDLFNLNFRPGINSSNLSIQNSAAPSTNTKFDNKLGFRFGIELELILPTHKNKWSFILEPTYQYYKAEKINAGKKLTVDYKSIELPFGLRHYFFLNKNSKIFINGSFVFDISKNSTIEYEERSTLKIGAGNNLAFGFGYKQNDKYSLELRYLTNRDILSNYVTQSSDYKTVSIIFGYSIL